ncbi:hypothetical protein LshimejAT787_0108930 [Lyophyllum shimeji]|uniref:Uncharacterized protein n=1 Tax=Lyophyllum shimeji TaxID=47721 RepID=A0A9P3PEA8_LYOSH|nr:hypothetical protein LshimejAT787_0108930 [Lyophyllum shimeji]
MDAVQQYHEPGNLWFKNSHMYQFSIYRAVSIDLFLPEDATYYCQHVCRIVSEVLLLAVTPCPHLRNLQKIAQFELAVHTQNLPKTAYNRQELQAFRQFASEPFALSMNSTGGIATEKRFVCLVRGPKRDNWINRLPNLGAWIMGITSEAFLMPDQAVIEPFARTCQGMFSM